MDRRKFLKILGLAPAAAVLPAMVYTKEVYGRSPALELVGPNMTAAEVILRQQELLLQMAERIVNPPIVNNVFTNEYLSLCAKAMRTPNRKWFTLSIK